MTNKTRGFTLIELLVVIAIIGILSSVVLASLNTARAKGNDAKIKAQLAGLRAAAEVFYDNNSTSATPYGTAFAYAACTIGSAGTTNTVLFTDLPSNMNSYFATGAWPNGVVPNCISTGTAYAVSATLPGAGTIWCVDSTGASKVGVIGAADPVC